MGGPMVNPTVAEGERAWRLVHAVKDELMDRGLNLSTATKAQRDAALAKVGDKFITEFEMAGDLDNGKAKNGSG